MVVGGKKREVESKEEKSLVNEATCITHSI